MSAAIRRRPGHSISPDGAVRRVHLLMRQRDALRPCFVRPGTIWRRVSSPTNSKAGRLACSNLADVNAGPSCLTAFWEISRSQPTEQGIASLIVAAHTAANVCRHAGAQADRRHDQRRQCCPPDTGESVRRCRAGGAPWTTSRCGPANRSRRQHRGWGRSCRRATSIPSRILSRPA